VVTAVPALSFRGHIAELSGSLASAALVTVVFATLWAAVGQIRDLHWLGSLFFLTVAVSWAVLIPAKFWGGRGDAWGRRVIMMVLGALIGLGAMWLEGWFPALPTTEPQGRAAAWEHRAWLPVPSNEVITTAAGYLSYFGLAFFALRWWKLADRRRTHRFSFFPVVAAAFWGLVLLFIWPNADYTLGTGALVTAAAVIQLVSPWEEPPPPPARRMRLRCA
jgi:hypothetical protein